jgi:hypothetical protein
MGFFKAIGVLFRIVFFLLLLTAMILKLTMGPSYKRDRQRQQEWQRTLQESQRREQRQFLDDQERRLREREMRTVEEALKKMKWE